MDGGGLGYASSSGFAALIERKFRIRPAARRDLDAYTDHLLAEAGADVAQRFVEQARSSFAALGETPGLGPPVPSQKASLFGLRKWKVDGFPKLLIFYIPASSEVRILRVLHAAQDWWSLLDIDQSQH
jgi:toxin ParE1/3/4